MPSECRLIATHLVVCQLQLRNHIDPVALVELPVSDGCLAVILGDQLQYIRRLRLDDLQAHLRSAVDTSRVSVGMHYRTYGLLTEIARLYTAMGADGSTTHLADLMD